MRDDHIPDPSTMPEAERLCELAALLAVGVIRRRDIARRCGEQPASQTGEIPLVPALNSPSIEAVMDQAVDAAQNGERR